MIEWKTYYVSGFHTGNPSASLDKPRYSKSVIDLLRKYPKDELNWDRVANKIRVVACPDAEKVYGYIKYGASEHDPIQWVTREEAEQWARES